MQEIAFAINGDAIQHFYPLHCRSRSALRCYIIMCPIASRANSSAPSQFEIQRQNFALENPLRPCLGMATNGPSKRANGTGTFQGLPHQDPAAIWARFQVDSERCRSRFAKLAKLPEWGGGLWQELYAEAFQVRPSCPAHEHSTLLAWR